MFNAIYAIIEPLMMRVIIRWLEKPETQAMIEAQIEASLDSMLTPSTGA